MDSERFDRLVIELGRQMPRRSLLGLLGGLGLTGYVTRKVAAQGCLPDGTRCGGSRGTCCSGWCKRKQGSKKQFCRAAPDQGICTTVRDFCAENSALGCDAGRTGSCACYVTSRGYSFCGQSPGECFACEQDADCEKRADVGQPGDRCVECAFCADRGTNNRICIHRCPEPATV